jgi:hypothetical protein
MPNFSITFSVATVLGCLLNDTSLIKDTDLNVNDFVNRTHKILFGAIQNLALLTEKKDLDVIDIDAYLSSTPTQYMVFEENRLADYITAIKEKAHADNFKYCYNTIFNSVPLSLHKKYNKNWAGSIRLQFSTEAVQEMQNILDYYYNWYNDNAVEFPIAEYTTAHENRQVE